MSGMLPVPREDSGCSCSCLELAVIANADVVCFSSKSDLGGSGNEGVEIPSIRESLLLVDVEFRRGLLLPNEGPRRLGRYREKNGLHAGSAVHIYYSS